MHTGLPVRVSVLRVTSAPRTAGEAEVPDTAETTGQSASPPTASSQRRRFPVDVAVCAGLVVAAAILVNGLLTNPTTGALALNANDQALMEWMLAVATRFFTGDLDLVSHLLNAPDGVNLMGNTSVLVIGLLLTPVTLAFGASVSFAVATFLNLAGTAVAWYLLFARTVRLHWAAAAIGGAFCAFAPGTMSQANSHLHMTAQWLLPPIVWCVIRLANSPDLEAPGWSRRVAALGALLGLLITVQLFVGEEPLFLTAVTLALISLAYAVLAPRKVRSALVPVVGGLFVAAGLSMILLAYPLWVQFAGPQHLPNGPFSASFFGADLVGYVSYSPLSIGGSREAERLVSGPAEYNTFFGLPLLLVVTGAAIWQWRRPVVVASAVTSVILGTLALGPQLIIDGEHTQHWGPYSLLANVPIVDSALPTRFALPLIPVMALVLAMAIDRALRDPRPALRFVVPAVIAVALLPVVPKPLPTVDRDPVPRFFTEGHWRGCVRPGSTLVPVPLPSPSQPDHMRWAAGADAAFAIPEGFFIAPYAEGGRASVGIYSQPTSQLLNEVAETGAIPVITDENRARAAEDVAYWKASCMVLANGEQPQEAALRTTLEGLFGPGRQVADVTVWRVGS